MKVGLVSPYDLGRFGGVQDQVFKLAAWLEEAGHETVVLGPGTAPEGSISLGPATVITVNGAATPIRLDPRLRRALERGVAGCDVVHVHEPLMPMVGPVAGRLRGVALVGTFHADPSRAVRTIYRWGRPLVRRTLSRFHVLTAVSPVAASAVAPVCDPVLVPNGLDVDSFGATAGNPMRVAFLGRDDPRKGLDVLLDAWEIVHRELPDAQLAVAAGDRSEVRPGVTFVGGLGEEPKRRFLSEAGIFCAPNLGGESFGIILAEAMASGCAVVASALAGFTHVLGDAGLLVKPGDVEGLADGLISLLRDPVRIAALQEAGRARVRRYDRSAVLAGYLQAYETALAIDRA